MSDLVERLREAVEWDESGPQTFLAERVMGQAADRIQQLERVLAQARAVFSLLLLETEDDVRVLRQTTRNARQSIAAIDEVLK